MGDTIFLPSIVIVGISLVVANICSYFSGLKWLKSEYKGNYNVDTWIINTLTVIILTYIAFFSSFFENESQFGETISEFLNTILIFILISFALFFVFDFIIRVLIRKNRILYVVISASFNSISIICSVIIIVFMVITSF